MSSFPCNTFEGGYGEGVYGAGGYGGGGGPSAYYLSLLTSEYQNSPNFLNWIASILLVVDDIHQGLCAMNTAFDLDQAVGIQLDALGQLVGAARAMPFQPSGGVSPLLDDNTYRIYIKAKIFQNEWNGQLTSLYSLWQQLFPGGQMALQDNQDMSATIFISGGFSSIVQDMIINDLIIPRPQTVRYNFVLANLPVFGFDQNSTYVAGFDVGHFA